VGVLTSETVTAVDTSDVVATIEDSISINIQDTKACPRYLGRVIKNVNPQAETPLWMQEKLRRSGVRSLSQ
jgi:phenylalanyl-tRNA synthetase beta chain